MAEKPISPEEQKRLGDRETFARWKAEVDFAVKDPAYAEWLRQMKKINKRYRDERSNAASKAKRRLNILWSNVQTLKPALYSRMPQPVVERRFMDRDPAARTASLILERVCLFQMEVGYFHSAVERSIFDYLLSGIAQVWVRYEPHIETVIEAGENEEIEGQERSAEDVAEEGDGTPYEKVAFEKVCVDYVHPEDFVWGIARCWNEVPWVRKRSYMTHSEIAERFFAGDLQAAKQVTLDYVPSNLSQQDQDDRSLGFVKKAEIWEIWNKSDRRVYFIAPGTPGVVLEERDDPLKLEGFFPCPEPLFATQTNDTIVPVPDFILYQDQAQELDDLTNRIANLTKAVKAAGVYDSSVSSLKRLLEEGFDNKLIPVSEWAAFAEKGGAKGAISLLPMEEIINVLLRLYEARAQVKSDLYEITGISDIVRGHGNPNETATAQRIKGTYAGLRLEDRKSAVARYCRDVLCIMAEIIAEVFSPESLMQMSGYDQIVQDRIRKAVESIPPPPPPQMPEGQPVDPAMQQQLQAQQQAALQQAQQQAIEATQQQAADEFEQALTILRSDKLRGFRIDIETDSTVLVDAQADKAAAIELMTATFQGLGNAAPLVSQAQELLDPISKLLMFAYRRFRVGRTIEASLEEALNKISERLETSQKQPSPDQLRAQAEAKKQEMETQRAEMEFKHEQAIKQMELQAKEREHAMRLEEMETQMALRERELALKEQEIALKEREMALKTAMQPPPPAAAIPEAAVVGPA